MERSSQWTGRIVNWRTNRDHRNYSIVNIAQNTELSLGDLTELAVTQTLVKDHQLTLVWKTHVVIIKIKVTRVVYLSEYCIYCLDKKKISRHSEMNCVRIDKDTHQSHSLILNKSVYRSTRISELFFASVLSSFFTECTPNQASFNQYISNILKII